MHCWDLGLSKRLLDIVLQVCNEHEKLAERASRLSSLADFPFPRLCIPVALRSLTLKYPLTFAMQVSEYRSVLKVLGVALCGLLPESGPESVGRLLFNCLNSYLAVYEQITRRQHTDSSLAELTELIGAMRKTWVTCLPKVVSINLSFTKLHMLLHVVEQIKLWGSSAVTSAEQFSNGDRWEMSELGAWQENSI